MLDQAYQQERQLIYRDEAHIHQDTDLGYGWAETGKRLTVSSCSPGLSGKITFFGLYYFNQGQVDIWPYPKGNQQHIRNVLERTRQKIPDQPVTLICDGAPYHRAHAIKNIAERLHIDIVQLPAYSPDFMPVEALWRWLREDVTCHHCYETKEALLSAVNQFCETINQKPVELADRLWVKNHIEEQEERLRRPPP